MFFTAAIEVRIPAGEVELHIANLYISTLKCPQGVIDYFYVHWIYLTAINLIPVR